MHVCMYACMSACLHTCLHVCMLSCLHVFMSACMHVCMHVCMHACMYACLYVLILQTLEMGGTCSSRVRQTSLRLFERRSNTQRQVLRLYKATMYCILDVTCHVLYVICYMLYILLINHSINRLVGPPWRQHAEPGARARVATLV